MDSTRRSVLIITYEFPPSGGGGVQRVAKFAKYLPASGWQPIVVAARPVPGRPEDHTLAGDVREVPVVRTPARSVRKVVSALLGPLRRLRRSGGGPSVPQAAVPPKSGPSGVAERVVQTLTSPDYAAFWIGTAARAAVRAGRAAGVSAVIASGPPHSALVAGERAARELGVPFVADMRDAWRDYPGAWYATPWHRARARALERRVLGAAAAVVTAADLTAEVRDLGGPDPLVLPNGFDPADLPRRRTPEAGPLTMVFMGTVYGTTDPLPVLQAMADLRRTGAPGSDARLVMVGRVPDTFTASVRALGLEDAVDMRGYLPHAQALEAVAGADVGLVVLRDTPEAAAVRPGKIYEYLGMGVPVLLVGPTAGASAELVMRARAGVCVGYDAEAAAGAIRELAAMKARGESMPAPDAAVVASFDRREQVRMLANVLDEVVRP